MVIYFHENLGQAFAEVERFFNQCREGKSPMRLKWLESCGATPIDVSQDYSIERNERDERDEREVHIIRPHSRVVLNLGEGYAAKVRPFGIRNAHHVKFKQFQNRTQHYIEEDNVRILRKYGFTEENGFVVPEHKVVGIHLVNSVIKVNPQGYGVTVTEDISQDGFYGVVDFSEKLFRELQNGQALETEYERHIQALLDLYYNPKINASVNRHGPPDNPQESIERTLLVKIKDDQGEFVIGDLDNLVFDEIELYYLAIFFLSFPTHVATLNPF